MTESSEPDRRTDKPLRDRLDEIQRGYEEWVTNSRRLLGWLIAIQVALFTIQIPLGVLSVYLLGQNRDRADEIQTSREQSARSSCLEQNKRHDDTIATLNNFVTAYKAKHPDATEKQRRDIQQSVDGNVSLINALVPKDNCAERVARLVKLKP